MNYDFVGEKNFLYTRFGILRRFGLFGLICELFKSRLWGEQILMRMVGNKNTLPTHFT